MRILSLFDGMSCGQIALRELGVEPEVYYASEIDPHAIRQTQHNFPATVQLGDVERWREWAIDWAGIDLVLAGSPCQGFSFAGKQLAFDDPRSRLFFVFVDILDHVRQHNPEVRFLLENVNMKREYLRVISEHVGVFPVRINSSLVSAQNRDRWYWTDIKTRREGLFGELHSDIPQPEDRGIVLADILETEVSDKYNVSEKMARYITDPKRLGRHTDLNDGSKKAVCLTAKGVASWTGTFLLQRPRGYNKGGKRAGKVPTLSAHGWERNNLLCVSSNQAHATVSVNKSTPILASAGMGGGHIPMVVQLNPSREFGGQPRQHNRIYDPVGKSPAIQAGMKRGGSMIALSETVRRLTPTECARLQTIPAWYEWVVSDSQIYRLLGNGWTVEVIKWILEHWDDLWELDVNYLFERNGK
ncbi:DNA (cytosine-5-)-methyltransferase [uncultured Rikenella sp.]|uniref:DNA (cytosine-5-)-methyltransferase n=1 Tax=uncultured Rikenella sp. TaxID=368003 RepID=UPI0025EDBC2A|nr:DNA (cytosine-5-)-methyltransferase [uncultured Rikenella sp.]